MKRACFRLVGCIPAVGLGTWGIGGGYWAPDRSRDAEWVDALRYAVERGISLIDTAEMYGGGHAEELVGLAIRGFPREELFLVSKVWPSHARYEDVLKSAERSAARLGTYIDLYLLHWPSDVPICETVRAFEALVDRGLIRFFGVSNFTLDQIKEAEACAKRYELAAVQNRYSLYYRRDEADVVPYALANGIMYMAYTPLEKGALARDRRLAEVGRRYGATATQIALAWYVKRGVVPIPKAEKRAHIDEIAGSLEVELREEDFLELARWSS
ncbi:aldo/keto reductase [Pyrobaculum neutrophilum]|uniref:Aldo/keto reductase n=1 Tax=Pyrobaculum neutrophilum (strain DSM 2338 / JCM 9278 / NBRC 100436 / V24Sta) TaxID=444157 RepID=B1YA03_PYRNV|nr:aldo/keto reductase [Pyrobaculum neutrophilum]ACB40553.1 aldo/keto reductase [Pyrobaculum neutrophilum V24Sta]